MPENSCATLAVAHRLGFFQKYGLRVELHKVNGWRHIHDAVIHGQLDAAQAPGTLPFLIRLGVTPESGDCVVGLILNLQGNAITVTRELCRLGVHDAQSLRDRMWRDRFRKTYTFGVPCPYSSQHALLRAWLGSVANPPLINFRLEHVPANQLFPLLKLGYLDGYCVGEPWTSVAVQAGTGSCLATSATVAPLHPDTVLMTTASFTTNRALEHEQLIAALIEASAFCDLPENRPLVCELIRNQDFVNAPGECLYPDLVGPFSSNDARIHSLHGLNMFHRCGANQPDARKAGWICGRLYDHFRWSRRPAALARVFRPDIYERAFNLIPKSTRSRCAKPMLPPTGRVSVAKIISAPVR